jgi:hypothetical protein
MNIFRSALSACVLSGLDTIRNLLTLARKQILDKQNPTTTSTSSIIAVGNLSAAVGALAATIDQITT